MGGMCCRGIGVVFVYWIVSVPVGGGWSVVVCDVYYVGGFVIWCVINNIGTSCGWGSV